jgi:hypothetical protein
LYFAVSDSFLDCQHAEDSSAAEHHQNDAGEDQEEAGVSSAAGTTLNDAITVLQTTVTTRLLDKKYLIQQIARIDQARLVLEIQQFEWDNTRDVVMKNLDLKEQLKKLQDKLADVRKLIKAKSAGGEGGGADTRANCFKMIPGTLHVLTTRSQSTLRAYGECIYCPFSNLSSKVCFRSVGFGNPQAHKTNKQMQASDKMAIQVHTNTLMHQLFFAVEKGVSSLSQTDLADLRSEEIEKCKKKLNVLEEAYSRLLADVSAPPNASAVDSSNCDPEKTSDSAFPFRPEDPISSVLRSYLSQASKNDATPPPPPPKVKQHHALQ